MVNKTVACLLVSVILPLAMGDLVTLAREFEVSQLGISAGQSYIGRQAALEVSPDDILLDQLQAARLAEIPELKVEFDERRVPTRLEGRLGFYSGDAPEIELPRLLQELGPAFRAAGTEELTQSSAHVNSVGIGVYRIAQSINGLWVHGASFMIITDANTGEITRIKSKFLPDRGLPNEPKIPAAVATEMAAEDVAFAENAQLQDIEVVDEPELVYHIGGHLAWRLILQYRINDQHGKEMVVIDALDGTLHERDDVMIE